MAKILVTGGQGFIGTNLVKELRGRGHDVWTSDIIGSPDPKSIRSDVGVFRQVQRLFESRDFEYVFHAAAEYGRWNGEDYYENLWRTNVVGTKNMLTLQAMKHFKMVQFSSAEVYGDYAGVMSEDIMDNVAIKQMNDYAMTKWVNEMQVLNTASMHGTESVRIRPFNVYGPGERYQPYRGFVPKFIVSALHDLPYTVYLGHKRSLEYVSDFCWAVANIADKFRPGEVYNLGGDEQYDIKQISDLILKLAGKTDAKIVYKETEAFTTKAKIPDSSKAKRDLGFKLTVKPTEGLSLTIKWIRSESKELRA